MPSAAVSRILVFSLALGALLSYPRQAGAWIERRVESSSTAIELDSSGSAVIRHELSLTVRGAPLTSFALEGVDDDAEPLADATITRMKGGIATSLPLPVKVTAQRGRAEIAVPLKKGFPGRTFQVSFAYRTQLLERGLLRALGDGSAELRWLGPRFEDGVDSVTLLVRSAAGARAPESEQDPAVTASGANFGIVMSTLRRSQAADELELVRAHVARGEATVWRILLDARLFPALATDQQGSLPPAMAIAAADPAQRASALGPPPRELLPWLGAGGLFYALLVRVKAWRLHSAARLRRCRPRSLAPWGASLRAVLAGASLSAAAALVLWGDIPALAAGALLLAVVFACERSPRAWSKSADLGSWQTLGPEALAAKPAAAVPGAWLDVGRPQGFVLLVATLGAVTWCAARLFETSPYYGASALLASVALLPIFCTGRAAQLPMDACEQTRRFASRALRRLSRVRGLVTTPIGRFGEGRTEPDELRLSVVPDRGVPGLLGLELGLEFRARLGGFSARPVVVVRAADGSPCQRALPRGISWGRGRKNDERATLIRPKLPTVSHSIALIQELLSLMGPESADAPARTSAAKSSGKGLSTAKGGTRSSPLHAT
jgi:hypothetical protein